MIIRPLLSTCLALVALLTFAASAQAVAAGTGVRGTLNLSWGAISGSPITAWDGSAKLYFDPSAGARSSTLQAIADPALGEAYRAPYAPQVQAARVTELTGTKTETVTCLGETADGSFYDYPASYTQSVAGVADGRVAFEILPPSVDLITGRGRVQVTLHAQMNPSGWYIQDHIVLPGRWNPAPSTYPCPGDGAPADRLPRIFSPNGQGAIPLNYTDWLTGGFATDWPLVRTTSGWKLKVNRSRRDTFSESRFGNQQTQQINMNASSDMYLAGSLIALQARCRVPYGLIKFAKTPTIAVRQAKRAGLVNVTYGGVRKSSYAFKPSYQITGAALDTMGHAPCGRGMYKIYRIVPR